MTGRFEPRENNAGERIVTGMGFELINENIRVDRNPPMPPEKSAKAVYSPLSRSLLR